MSNFCTKCGASITPESTFCPNCGTPIPSPGAQAPGTATAAVQPPVTAYVPVAAAPQPPPAYVPVPVQPMPVQQTASGGGALKIILIVVGVFVLLGVIGASVVGFIGWRVAHAVHLDKNNGGLSIDTSNGTISAGGDSAVRASDLGVDAYPGAARGAGSLNLHSPEGSMVSANYTTSDSVSQVVDFYKSKLGDNVNTTDTGSGTLLTSADADSASKVMVTVTPQGNNTKISIVHTVSKKN